VLLNIVQLVGWTTFELVVMRDGMQAIVHQVTGADVPPVVGTLIWGGVLTLLMTGSMLTLVRRFVSRIGLPLVILSLLWLSWHFLGVAKSQGFQAFLDAPGDGSMSLASAIDLVIAMPVSWLPLVADYARHGRSGGTTLRGTWFGYTVANIWCYALGVLVARVTAPGTELLSALLLAQGGLLALGLILLDELDNAYGDTYSAAVSTSSTLPKWTVRQWGIATALLSTFLGCLLPMHSLEPFLLTLSSVFVPLFGVILGRLGWGQHGNNPISRTIDGYAVVIWLFGIAIFHGLATWAPEMGSALPSLTFTFVLASFTRHSDRGACAAC
jgi:putative hydroxymethylpyrimidine transporter CytX